MKAITALLALVAACASPCFGCLRSSNGKKVLLLSFDGFRWDYFSKVNMPNFAEVADTGVKAPYVYSTFNTKSIPTHYSIATGLYQEHHGMVGNHFYDPALGHFDRKNQSHMRDPRWWLGEPIWKTVRGAGRVAATYFWPGSETALSDPDVDKKFVKIYNESVPFSKRVDQVLDWFTKDDVDFATLYYHQPDADGHKRGPDSPKMVATLTKVDGDLGYLLKRLKSEELWDKIDLIIVSDHGMTTMSQQNIVNLVDLPNFRESDVEFTGDWGTLCQIEPAEGSHDNVYNSLRNAHPHLTPYLKEDLPDRWHFRNTDRVMPIVVVADEGYNCRLKNDPKYTLPDIGTHGYDNKLSTMRTIFLARGPSFKSGYTPNATLNIVDTYPLICEILGITPATNDGDLTNVKDMIDDTPVSSANSLNVSTLLVLAGMCAKLAFHD